MQRDHQWCQELLPHWEISTATWGTFFLDNQNAYEEKLTIVASLGLSLKSKSSCNTCYKMDIFQETLSSTAFPKKKKRKRKEIQRFQLFSFTHIQSRNANILKFFKLVKSPIVDKVIKRMWKKRTFLCNKKNLTKILTSKAMNGTLVFLAFFLMNY